MRVLVVGGGAREHALCVALKRSAQVEKLWCAPGNDGIAQDAECVSRDEANRAVAEAMEQRRFGDSGTTVVIEEFLRGEEVSVHAITDGDTLLVLPSAQDHKRLHDGDRGPNTGGMGAYSPAPILSERAADAVVRTILVPILHALKIEGVEYRGV